MSNIIHSIDPENNSSPFDAIRQFDVDGVEWWSARDLQKMLGYKAWQMFDNSIDLGLDNLESAVGDISSHALILEITLKHQKAKDYKLSRLACYHIALACDSRGKPNVKAAKHYFAIKAREAELTQVTPKSPAEMLMVYAQMFLEQERRQLAIELEQKVQAEEIAHLKLINETQDLEISANSQELDRFKNGHGYYFTIAGWCSKNSVKKSLEELKVLGRQAAALCRMRQITPEKVNDPRWGTVGCYPDSVLMELVL